MNQNKNTPYYSFSAIMPIETQQQTAEISIFNLQQEPNAIIEQNKINRRNSFNSFISSRTRYLNGLSKLGDNWISGMSKQPSMESIDLAKDVLNNIVVWYGVIGYEKNIFPKIIMSPTPAGGIAMEIEVRPSTRAYITILNDNTNFELETNGLFVEQEANKENISEKLLTLYNSNEG
jgi:hypothetical protein